MRSLVPLLLLTFSLHATPISISPERPVAPLGLADATLYVNSVSGRVASDGHSFLAAWTASYTTGLGAILTAAVDANGSARPAAALPYRVDADLLAMGWTGEAYRLVWQDRANLNVFAADVDDEGHLVHPRVLLGRALYFRAAAFLPDRTLVVLRDSNDRASIIGTDGTVIRSDFAVQAVAVTADDRGFMLFSANPTPQFTSTLQMQHLTADGAVDGDAVSIVSMGVVGTIAAAFNSGHYGVTLFESVVASNGIVQSYAVRRFIVDAAGQATELAPVPVPVGDSIQGMHVIPDAGGFLAWWRNGSNQLATVRFGVSGDGPIERRNVEMLPGDSVALAAGGRELGIDGALAGFFLDDTTRFRIARYPVAQTPHGIASLGNQSLVVWSELDDPPYSDERALLAMRIDASGTPLDREPLRLGSTHWYNNYPLDIAVVAAGSRYWIAWPSVDANNPTVLLRSVETSGTLGELITTPFHGEHVALATDGSILLLAFAGSITPLGAARFLANGTLLDPTPLALGTRATTPRVTWNGETFVVAWSEGSSPCSKPFCPVPFLQRQVVAARISAGGVDLDPAPIPLTPIHQASDFVDVTAAASRDGETLVAWTEKGAAMTRRLSREGTAFDAPNLLGAAMTVRALQPFAGGYLAFAARSSDTRVLQLDGEEVGKFEGVTIAATQRSDGKWVVLESRPADAREAAGATQVFTRVVSLAAPRLRAVRALPASPPTAPQASQSAAP